MSAIPNKKDSIPKIVGTFSSIIKQEIGVGATKRKVVHEFLYYAEEHDNEEIALRPLNDKYVPIGEEQIISKDELLESFTAEIELHTKSVFPAMKELSKCLARADRQRQLGKHFTAEMEYGKVLNIDENNIRAIFGMGLCYLERQDDAKSKDLFSRLIELDAAFSTEHKHIFNDFGISLRKNKKHTEAIEFYTKALNFCSDDENLLFNIARCLYEIKKKKEACDYLDQCLEINPDFKEATKLKTFIKNN
ncbi:MAG: hypothetical protein BA863_15935 [Desulfovibrio sp. S3730MH75]|nr:MAG: hypothetical protein BA863_15935 [Desulfovibrio sp. S3730MH75]